MKHLLFTAVLLFSIFSFSQVGAGIASPAFSTALERSRTNNEFLLTRLTYAQKTAIITPATALIICCSYFGISEKL
jgi:hypothetical protein